MIDSEHSMCGGIALSRTELETKLAHLYGDSFRYDLIRRIVKLDTTAEAKLDMILRTIGHTRL